MTTIYPVFFSGTRAPPSHNNRCTLEALKPEKSFQNREVQKFKREEAQGIIDHFDRFFDEKTDPDYWKFKTIFYMIVCPGIISMTFWPKSSTIPQLIRIQNQYTNIRLTEQHLICSGFSYIHDRQSIEDSIASIENTSLKQSMINVLSCFLHDECTNYLVITLLNTCNTPFSWGWKKQ